MKRPCFSEEQRFILKIYREGYQTIFGAQLELVLAWKKLGRNICKDFLILLKQIMS